MKKKINKYLRLTGEYIRLNSFFLLFTMIFILCIAFIGKLVIFLL